MRMVIIIAALLEVVLVLGGGAYAIHRLRRRRRHEEPDEGDPAGAPGRGRPRWVLGRLQRVLETALPLPIARILMLEPRLWWCFGAWALRRRPKGTDAFSYHKRSPLGPMVVVVFLTTPVEILLLEILIPWLWLRIALLVAAAYALFWVVALYASLVVLPHRVNMEGVLLRYGALAEIWVPFEGLAEGRADRQTGPRGSLGFSREGFSVAAEEAFLVVGGRTDLVLDLVGSLPAAMLRGDRPVRHVYLAADAPEALLSALQSHLAQHGPRAATRGPNAPNAPQTPGVTSTGSDAVASIPR